MLKLSRRLLFALTCLALLIGAPTLAYAASGDPSTQAVAQSYGADTTIQTGMIVGLKKGDANKVVPLPSSDDKGMQGVVISATDAAITLSGDSSSTQVYVATSGRYNVLVSNQNGVIHSGDYVSISALDGIGMKAGDIQAVVLGKAATDFSGTGNVVSTATLKNSNGTTTTVAIGSIPVDVSVANNPELGRGLGNLPGFLQVAGNSVADKQVDASRVYISLAVLLLSAIIAGSILYSGVKNGLVSIGRNPLAKRYIVRGLLQVILVSIIIFIIGLFAVYLLLRL